MLKKLWQQGFFEIPRKISEVASELSAKGYNYPPTTLRITLLRAAGASGFLTRINGGAERRYIQRGPLASPAEERVELFERYDFHPRIKEVAYQQFEDGYFKEAIQNALVEVIDQVKVRTGHPKDSKGHDLDGDDLMNRVFGCDNQTPQIQFNNLQSGLDKAEQRGLMYLFKGIVGVRDRKAHLNFLQKSPLKTIEYLSLASLLMRLLDENAPDRKKKS
ncbi:MAG: TIGR02391 family protein [Patescibacteria group bacterium]